MRTFLVTLCFVAATFPVCADLLQNPSFEEQGNASDLAAHWYRWGQWINREDGWNPTHSGKCMIGYHHWRIEDANDSGIWQDVAGVKTGQRYKFSVFAWFDKTDAPARQVELRLEATRNGQQVTIESAKFLPKDFPAGQWHQLSVTGTTPEDNLRVLIVVTPSSAAPRGGAIKFDDASLGMETASQP